MHSLLKNVLRKLLPACVITLLAAAAGAEQKLIIADNDFLGPGGSDMQSLLPLLGNRDVTVLGFTVVTGNGWCAEETAYLLRFLEIAKLTRLPVVPGAVFPLVNSQTRMAAWEKMYGTIPWKGAWNEVK